MGKFTKHVQINQNYVEIAPFLHYQDYFHILTLLIYNLFNEMWR